MLSLKNILRGMNSHLEPQLSHTDLWKTWSWNKSI